jgi:hypothetical protein
MAEKVSGSRVQVSGKHPFTYSAYFAVSLPQLNPET